MTPQEFKSLKNKRKISVLTCYDYSFAAALDGTVDALLVGDSVEMVLFGKQDTKQATMQQMLSHVSAVSKGAPHTLVIADMPIGTYGDPITAMKNASLMIQAGAHAVKMEGDASEQALFAIASGIPVMGHVGLLPQTAQNFALQGKTPESSQKILQQAKALDNAGVFAIVIEHVPQELAAEITQAVSCPAIGIGAGAHCDGQILVSYDALGLYPNIPKFAKKFADLSNEARFAAQEFSRQVQTGEFPPKSE